MQPRHLPLGKRIPRHDARTLQIAKYLTPRLPDPPRAVAWTVACDEHWPMYANDRVGDCTCATAAHLIQAWTANGQAKEIEVSERSVLDFYTKVTGYDPARPSTDKGAVELDVLRAWRKTGIVGLRGRVHKIGAFAAVSLSDRILVEDSIHLFGGIYTGFALPESAQEQSVWDVPPGGTRRGKGKVGSWGGHAVPILDYDPRGLTCITWGKAQRMTWSFFKAYCDEAYAILSEDFLSSKTKKTPAGFDLETLRRDLDLVKSK